MPISKDPAPPTVAARLRDRIVELRRVPASELHDNERNWRLHPYAQQQAVAESLETVGIADALIAYHSERNDGQLTLIDGHLRRGENDDTVWPTLIVDLTDDEADQLLLSLDPIAAMADADPRQLQALLDDVHTGTPALEDLFRLLTPGEQALAEADAAAATAAAKAGPPEMELQAMEHYDYIVLIFRNALDWSQAKDRFGIRHEGFTLRDGVNRRIGLGRVVDGARVLRELDAKP